MAGFRDVHLYPYSGWHRRPWGMPDTRSRDVDAAARTARRVTEAISRELGAGKLTSAVSSYRIFTEKGSSEALELKMYWSPRDPFLGSLRIPRDFRFLTPQERAELLADAVQAALLVLAEKEAWDASVVCGAVQSVRNDGFRCAWVGPWKSSRDRKFRVRLEGQIVDDGYRRWHLVRTDRESDVVMLESDEVLGWTWLSNLDRAAKSMRWVNAGLVEIKSGSDMLPEMVQVDVRSGKVLRRGREPRPTNYPGDTERAPSHPELVLL